jgi:hypothetical protein
MIAIAGAVMLTVALTTGGTGGRVAASTTEAEGRTAMADRTPERTQSHAFAVLRPSSRRLLMFIETEIARSDGGSVTLYMDQFEVVGSRNVVLPGLSELHALGDRDALDVLGDIQIGLVKRKWSAALQLWRQ